MLLKKNAKMVHDIDYRHSLKFSKDPLLQYHEITKQFILITDWMLMPQVL